jgi:ribonuclease HI
MIDDINAVKIYIDGSAFKNPGNEGGFGLLLEYPNEIEDKEISVSGYKETTIQRMELKACIYALKYIRNNLSEFRKITGRVIIITDSDYVYSNQNRAIYWRKEKWKNKEGRPIENPDLWKEFLSVKSNVGINTEITLQKGKSTPNTKRVDKLAKQSAKSSIKRKDYGYRIGKIGRSKVRSGNSPTLFPANNQEEIIHVYYYTTINNQKEIKFDLFSKEENKFISKHVAYLIDNKGVDIHRHGHYYKVRFNSNSKYPIIKYIKETKNPIK